MGIPNKVVLKMNQDKACKRYRRVLLNKSKPNFQRKRTYLVVLRNINNLKFSLYVLIHAHMHAFIYSTSIGLFLVLR